MKVQSEMCQTCPWRPKTFVSLIRGDVTEEVRKTLKNIEKIHVCHESYDNFDTFHHKTIITMGKRRRCRGSYLWRKKQFKNGAIRFQGQQQVVNS